MSPESDNRQQKKDTKGWRPLKEIFGGSHPFFEECLFLEGYDISSNIYILKGDYLSIVDPGNDYTAYIQLFEQGHKPTDIKKVFITHGHPEHAMGALELLRYPSIKEQPDMEIIMGDSGPESFVDLIKGAGCPTSIVKNGDIINLSGFDFEVVHTPGHTMDSVCLYHAPTKSIFTGDTVLPHAIPSPDEIGGGRADYYLFSLRILRSMEIENLLPGHGAPVAKKAKTVIEGNFAGAIKQVIGLKTPWIEGAAVLAQKGYLEEALFCCEKTLEEDPNDVRALELKASCLSDTGRFKEALEAFDCLERLQKDYPFALVGKGYSLMGLGEYEDSLHYFDRALSVHPDTTTAKVYKGMALYLLGRYDEAMEIKEFQTEFVSRFKEEMEKKKRDDATG